MIVYAEDLIKGGRCCKECGEHTSPIGYAFIGVEMSVTAAFPVLAPILKNDIDLVRSKKIEVYKEQFQLCDYVEACFKKEKILI